MSTIKTETLSTPSNATVPVDTEVNGTAKAWVNFNGTGTVAIRRAFNVYSITDNGAGDYTANFTTAMADENYAAVGSIAAASLQPFAIAASSLTAGALTKTTTALRIYSYNNSSSKLDAGDVNVAIFS